MLGLAIIANLESMKISVLGVGTELTNGQILNRNGQWISERMMALGVPTAMHLVVPDDKPLIQQALQTCWQSSDLIFVTGGLGPTSDDFTREVVAQWLDKKLVWHEASWTHIEERLIPRGIQVKDIQRQQCYFPEGTQVLKNRMGTANAFQIEHHGKTVFVLPGPPNEIEAIWQDHLQSWLETKTSYVDALITHSWDTMGLGESDVADRVEAAVIGSGFEMGYRVHMPFVEVKLSHRRSQAAEAQKWIQAVNEAIGPLTVLHNGEDAAEKVARYFENFDHVWICDEIPGSFLLHRLFPFCKKLLKGKKLHFSSAVADSEDLEGSVLRLHLREDSFSSGRAWMEIKGQMRSQYFMSPYKSALLREREQQYYAEMALIFWMKELSDDFPNSISSLTEKP